MLPVAPMPDPRGAPERIVSLTMTIYASVGFILEASWEYFY